MRSSESMPCTAIAALRVSRYLSAFAPEAPIRVSKSRVISMAASVSGALGFGVPFH